jgi:hypothetical protein
MRSSIQAFSTAEGGTGQSQEPIHATEEVGRNSSLVNLVQDADAAFEMYHRVVEQVASESLLDFHQLLVLAI